MATKTVNETKTTKKPNLSVSRDKLKITFSWKITDTDHGAGQEFQWRLKTGGKWGKWQDISCSKTVTSKKITSLSESDYYPYSNKPVLNAVQGRVRGTRKKTTEEKTKDKTTTKTITTYTKSDWDTATFEFSVPAAAKPRSVTQVNDHTHTYGADVPNYSDTGKGHVTRIKWWSRLIKDNTVTDGDKLKFSSGQLGFQEGTFSGTGGSVSIEENTVYTESGSSYTRWVRFRPQGVAGHAAKYSYAKHIYSTPSQAKDVDVKKTNTTDSGYEMYVTWTADSNNKNNPIDSTVVQYKMAVPTGLDLAYNGSYDDAPAQLQDTAGKDQVRLSLDEHLGLDQCLYVRVNTVHDNHTTYGSPYIAKKGKLKPPTISAADVTSSTTAVSVTASNNSDVPGAYLEVYLKRNSSPSNLEKLGVMTSDGTQVFSCADFSEETSVRVCVRAVVESSKNGNMYSDYTEYGGNIPLAPSSVTAVPADGKTDTILVSWNWTWADANQAELSWADHEDAWESTDEPDTYIVSRVKASRWYITGVESGKTWYVRVRLIQETDETTKYGAYSDIESVDMSVEPSTPYLEISPGIATEDGKITFSWAYVSEDGTTQEFAQLAAVTVSGGSYVYTPLTTVNTAQSYTETVENLGLTTGQTYQYAVNVTSSEGKSSGWSDPASVTIAEPITCSIAVGNTNFETVSETIDGITYTTNYLRALPFTVTATGAGADGTTVIYIERAEQYVLARPDGTESIGYEGEVVYNAAFVGESAISVTQESLDGYLDDGAMYRIVAIVTDSVGQTATAQYPFTVGWTHQAITPDGSVYVDQDDYFAIIGAEMPSGATSGDVVDIYRLTIDGATLIVNGGEWGVPYLDPYPTIGEMGGYRIVFRSRNGDYITANNTFAWDDVEESLDTEYTIIDFGGERIFLHYNIDFSNTWKKEFVETKYLDGSVQGDWLKGVSRTGTINTVAIQLTDEVMIAAMRRLAEYTGICHVRTQDGSNFTADIQVQESRSHDTGGVIVSFTLSFTRIDPVGYDAIVFANGSQIGDRVFYIDEYWNIVITSVDDVESTEPVPEESDDDALEEGNSVIMEEVFDYIITE